MWLECAIETFPSESTTASIELLAMTEMSHVFCVRFITYDTPEKQMGSNKFKVASIVMFFFFGNTLVLKSFTIIVLPISFEKRLS